MMEEINEEQPEIVSHEEAVQAEKEATQNFSGYSSGLSSPYVATPGAVSAPSPLPAFLSKPTLSQVPPPLLTSVSKPPVTSAVSKLLAPASSHLEVSATSTPVSSPSSEASSTTTIKNAESPATRQWSQPDSQEEQHKLSSSPAGGQGLFSWISGSSLVNKVMEKTKSSMETVITTLDPGMKDIIYSGAAVNIVVTSTKDCKLVPVREAFQQVFRRVLVTGQESQSSTACQPVGFTAGLKGAEERISNLKKSGQISHEQTVVSIEGFIVEILPDSWFEMSCLLLQDPAHGIELRTFSQPTPVPSEVVHAAQDQTPSNYPLRWAGLAVTVGEVIEASQPHIGRADWQMVLSGVSRRQSLQLAAQALAYMYKQKLPSSFIS